MNYYITSYSDFHDDDTKPRMFEYKEGKAILMHSEYEEKWNIIPV